jgi:PTH1 family peptidyl-tRNA hydrolase
MAVQRSVNDEIQGGDDAAAQACSLPRRTVVTTNDTNIPERNTERSQHIEPSPMAARSAPLLICSIGNPGVQYANTYHSAGHVVLNKLADQLGYSGFQKDPELGGLTSRPLTVSATGNWTLWQSPLYMNESGRGVHAAYKAWSRNLPVGETGKLVIVHDELEAHTGKVSLKTTQGASARGHNGLKSIIEVLAGSRTPFYRIGIGIGRPVSREQGAVSNYVLQKMTNGAHAKMEAGLPKVIQSLKRLEGL